MHLFPLAALLPFAQAVPDAAGAAQAAAARFSTGDLIKLGALLLLSQVVIVLSYWIASQLVAREKGRFVNALKTWGLYLVAVIGLSFLGAFLFPAIAANFPRLFLIAIGVFVLLAVAITFQVPMKVYEIGFGSALGFLVISFVLTSAAHLAIDRAMGLSSNKMRAGTIQLTPDQRAKLWSAMERVVGKRPRANVDETIAGDPKRPIAERHAALGRVHRALQTQHAALKDGDQPALDAYNQALARYEKLVQQIEAAQAP